MKRILAGLVILGVVAGSGSAFAAQAKAKKEHLDFETDVIRGVTVGPGIDVVLSRPSPKFDCLVKTRGDFLPELHRSVDAL
jgi:hypothetical protein